MCDHGAQGIGRVLGEVAGSDLPSAGGSPDVFERIRHPLWGEAPAGAVVGLGEVAGAALDDEAVDGDAAGMRAVGERVLVLLLNRRARRRVGRGNTGGIVLVLYASHVIIRHQGHTD